MREIRSTSQITANQIDLDLFRLSSRIDELAEMTSRGRSQMDRALVEAASKVAAARSAVRKHMHKTDIARTV